MCTPNTIFFLLPNTRRKSFFNYDKRQLCGTSQSDISRATPLPQSNYLLRNWFFFFSTFVMDKSARPYNTITRIHIHNIMCIKNNNKTTGRTTGRAYIILYIPTYMLLLLSYTYILYMYRHFIVFVVVVIIAVHAPKHHLCVQSSAAAHIILS